MPDETNPGGPDAVADEVADDEADEVAGDDAAPDASGAGPLPDDGAPIVPSRAADRFKRTVPGAILSGAALALRDLLDPKVNTEAPIVMEAPGDPPGDRPVDVDLDPDDPSASSVLVRPHLLDDRTGT